MFCAPSYLDASNVKRLCGRYPSDPSTTHKQHTTTNHTTQTKQTQTKQPEGLGEGRKKRRDGNGERHVKVRQQRPIRIKSVVIKVTELLCKGIDIHLLSVWQLTRADTQAGGNGSLRGDGRVLLITEVSPRTELKCVCGKRVTILSDYAMSDGGLVCLSGDRVEGRLGRVTGQGQGAGRRRVRGGICPQN